VAGESVTRTISFWLCFLASDVLFAARAVGNTRTFVMSCSVGSTMATVSCRSVSGSSASASSARASRAGSAVAFSGRPHVFARGRSAVRCVLGGLVVSPRPLLLLFRDANAVRCSCVTPRWRRTRLAPTQHIAPRHTTRTRYHRTRSSRLTRVIQSSFLAFQSHAVRSRAIILALQARRQSAALHWEGWAGQNRLNKRGFAARRGDWGYVPDPNPIPLFQCHYPRRLEKTIGGAGWDPPKGRALGLIATKNAQHACCRTVNPTPT